MTVKLRKNGRTEIRRIEKPISETMGIQSVSTTEYEEVEGELWEDLDGNVYAWTPKNSGVIAIEIKSDNEDAPVQHYKKLKEVSKKQLSTEERIAALEEALAAALRRIAELEH